MIHSSICPESIDNLLADFPEPGHLCQPRKRHGLHTAIGAPIGGIVYTLYFEQLSLLELLDSLGQPGS